MLAEAKREAERIVKEARERAEQLVSQEEVTKEAERAAEDIIEDARAREREIRLGAEDYADEILNTLEVNLSKAIAAALPASASATIVYEKSPFRPAVYAAADDGSARVKLADGELPRISPDGTTVAYETPGLGGKRPTLRVIPAAGGDSRLLLKPVWYSYGFSPDAQTIAAVTGKEVGRKSLVLIDVASGAVRKVDSGQFSG